MVEPSIDPEQIFPLAADGNYKVQVAERGFRVVVDALVAVAVGHVVVGAGLEGPLDQRHGQWFDSVHLVSVLSVS